MQVAFNFVPSRQAFMEKVAGKDDPEAVKDMQAFIDAFSPVLAEAHKFLVSGGHRDSRWHSATYSASQQQLAMHGTGLVFRSKQPTYMRTACAQHAEVHKHPSICQHKRVQLPWITDLRLVVLALAFAPPATG